MQSEFAAHMDIRQLPTVIGFEDGAAAGMRPVIRVFLENPSAGKSTIASMDRTRLLLPYWHEVDMAKQTALLGRLTRCITSGDAPLVLESVVEVLYPRLSEDDEEGYVTESDLSYHGRKCSTLRLAGTCCTSVSDAMRNDVISVSRIRNAVVRLKVFPPAHPLQVDFDALTAEHRVKGLYYCITCTHCKKRLRTEKEGHFRCLSCPQKTAGVCFECYSNRAHPLHHVAVKLRADISKLHPTPIWGVGNITMLPTLQGKLVANVSKAHHDVYCNGCRKMIIGERYKCCCCHEFDFCMRCEAAWWYTTFVSGAKSPRVVVRGDDNGEESMIVTTHPETHYFLHIRCAVPGDPSSFLQPLLSELDEATLVDH
jgi:hypothetical protein